MRLVSLLAVTLLASVASQPAARTVLQFGHLWDGTRLLDDVVVVVERDRIASVTDRQKGTRPGAVDLRRYTAIPGLIDLHTHMTYYWDGFRPEVVPPLQEYIAKNLEATRRAVKAGVRIGMGSDAVFSMFGQNTRELEWMVKAGMTPAQALATATTVAAALLGQQDRLGRLAPGFAADIVAIEGRPLEDIRAVITGVRWVMKDGRVASRPPESGTDRPTRVQNR